MIDANLDIVFTAKLNLWKGQTNVELDIKDLRLQGDDSQTILL